MIDRPKYHEAKSRSSSKPTLDSMASSWLSLCPWCLGASQSAEGELIEPPRHKGRQEDRYSQSHSAFLAIAAPAGPATNRRRALCLRSGLDRPKYHKAKSRSSSKPTLDSTPCSWLSWCPWCLGGSQSAEGEGIACLYSAQCVDSSITIDSSMKPSSIGTTTDRLAVFFGTVVESS